MTSRNDNYGSIVDTESGGGGGGGGGGGDDGRRRDTTRTAASRNNAGSTKFLHAIKAVQMANRLEKMAKRMSASTSQPTTRARAGNDDGDDDDDNDDKNNNDTMNMNPLLLAPAAAKVLRGIGGKQEESSSSSSSDEGAAYARPALLRHLFQMCFGKGIISWGLIAGPLALVANALDWNDTAKFWLNFVVMIPLASILGDFTEEVAFHTNEVRTRVRVSVFACEHSSSHITHTIYFFFFTHSLSRHQTIGGLINATFGNAVEVVVAIQALLANEIRVVQSSMLGSIFSNLLLVLGGCFFFGGLKYPHQNFNATAATSNMGLLALSAIAMVLPTPFAHYYNMHDEHVLLISRLAAIFLIFMYAQLLVFQLYTHASVFTAADGEADGLELSNMSLGTGILGLLVTTLLVTVFSDYLVDSIDGFTEASGFSRTFVGIILLPIVGNAVEHVAAIQVARKDKMDLAMGIAVGSCTQISLFVVPLTVLVGWCIDRDMNLNFPHFEVILFVLSIFTVSVVLGNPSSHWLEGSLLMTTYVMIGVGFWFEDVQTYSSTGGGGNVGEL